VAGEALSARMAGSTPVVPWAAARPPYMSPNGAPTVAQAERHVRPAGTVAKLNSRYQPEALRVKDRLNFRMV
jgi:hypothetical protein